MSRASHLLDLIEGKTSIVLVTATTDIASTNQIEKILDGMRLEYSVLKSGKESMYTVEASTNTIKKLRDVSWRPNIYVQE